MLRTLNCCSSKPIDLGWTTMNTMAIETATQNFLIGQVVMMDIYTDDNYVLAFVILYPLIILFISVSLFVFHLVLVSWSRIPRSETSYLDLIPFQANDLTIFFYFKQAQVIPLMIGYQLYAKFCKNNSKIDGFENKAFDDGIEDYPEKDYPEVLKHEHKYASKL